MPLFDTWAFALVAVLAALLYWRLHNLRGEPVRLATGNIAVAGVGRSFCNFIDKFIERGCTLIVPAGDGLYHLRHKAHLNSYYLRHLTQWIGRGATIKVIISSPSEEAIDEWRPYVAQFGDQLQVFLLDRTQVDGELRKQIEIIDNFHATLLLAPQGSANAPGAMWIEQSHPLGSKFAFDIIPVTPSEAAKSNDLQWYKAIYDRMLRAPIAARLTAEAALKAA